MAQAENETNNNLQPGRTEETSFPMSERNGECAFIDDGYTLDGYIARVPHSYPAIRFKYRPTLSAERARFLGSIQSMSKLNQLDRIEKETAKIIAKCVQEWDITDSKGNPVEVTAANTLKLHPEVNGKLYAICIGVSPSEDDPDAGLEETDQETDSYEHIEEADVKN